MLQELNKYEIRFDNILILHIKANEKFWVYEKYHLISSTYFFLKFFIICLINQKTHVNRFLIIWWLSNFSYLGAVVKTKVSFPN